MRKRKAIFLDKDGTLVNDVPYNVDPAKITYTPGALDALKAFSRQGYCLMIVSNQSGIARGYFPEEALSAVWSRIIQDLEEEGVVLDGFYFCPHHPCGIVDKYAVACTCRKPAPGMLLRAATEHHIDLDASWMIGDILNDVEAGKRAGCKTVLIDNGNETEWIMNHWRQPDLKVKDLKEAAYSILNTEVVNHER